MSTRPTLADLARELGISPSTVSRALRDHPAISDARKAEVRAGAEALGLTLGTGQRPSELPPGKLLACVIPSLTHPFFANVVERFEAVCALHDAEVILHCSGAQVAVEAMIVQSLVRRGVDGVVFIPTGADLSALLECQKLIPTVVITQHHETIPSIGINHAEGGWLAAEHFQELGRSSCLLVGPPHDVKFKGFVDYIEAQRLTDFQVEYLEVDGWTESLSARTRRALLDRFTKESVRRFDCVFAFTDLVAFGVLQGLKSLDVRVPEDIAVCGFDDTPLAREFQPALSSIAQPVGQMVRSGYSMLEQLMSGHRSQTDTQSFTLKPHLVVRASTFSGPLDPSLNGQN